MVPLPVDGAFHQLLKLGEPGQNGRLALLLHTLLRILGKSGNQASASFALKKNKVFRRLGVVVPLDGKIHTVLAGRPLKALDIFVGDLNIGNARALPDKLPDALLTLVGLGTALFCLAARCWASISASAFSKSRLNVRAVSLVV